MTDFSDSYRIIKIENGLPPGELPWSVVNDFTLSVEGTALLAWLLAGDQYPDYSDLYDAIWDRFQLSEKKVDRAFRNLELRGYLVRHRVARPSGEETVYIVDGVGRL